MSRGGRPDLSLPFYEQAATLARAAGVSGKALAAGMALESDVASPAASDLPLSSWADLAAITGNWANALGDVGNPDAARQRLLEAAEAHKKADHPAIHVIGSELEALRIDILQGQVTAAQPQVEARLAQVAAWWQRHRFGQDVPEAPHAEFLARAFISALDIARDADFAREDWKSALGRIDASLEVERALERPAEDIGVTRMNRANVLVRLGRFGEARAELEDCLQLFQNNPAVRARVLGSLADLFDEQGDVAQAITQERRALTLCEQLPDPEDRAISHNNLANYLERRGTPSALAESPRHQLAAFIYFLAAGMNQYVQHVLGNYYVKAFRRARAAGTELAVPRVAQLLADPAFHPLDQWLLQRQVDPDALQAAIDQLLEQARQAAFGEP